MKSEPAQAVALIALAVAAVCVVVILIVAVVLEAPRKARDGDVESGADLPAPLRAISDCVGHERIADYVAHKPIRNRVDGAIAANSHRRPGDQGPASARTGDH
jgi:hypothetical protein